MALTYGTVTGRFDDMNNLTGSVSGNVYFVPEVDYLLTDDATILLPSPVMVPLTNEAFSVSLLATDDPSLNPVDWSYKVIFELTVMNRPFEREGFSIKVPAGVTTDLATLTPVAASEGSAILRGEQGAVGPAGPQGPVGPTPAGVMVYRGDFSLKTITFDSGLVPADWTSNVAPLIIEQADVGGGTTKALTFPDVTDNQTVWVEFPITSPGNSVVTIRYAMESETSFDKFTISDDGVVEATNSGMKTAAVPATVNVETGVNRLRLTYSKDGSESVGYDNVRITSIAYADSENPYVKNNVVRYAGNLWLATVDYASVTPGTTPTQWIRF